MTAPSYFHMPLFVQTLGPEQAALPLDFIGFLLGQLTFIIGYLIFHEICVGVQQTVQQSFRRGHILGTIPSVPLWLPSHQSIAMASGNDLIERVLLKIIAKDGQYFLKCQHQATPYT